MSSIDPTVAHWSVWQKFVCGAASSTRYGDRMTALLGQTIAQTKGKKKPRAT
jgi:hypothetical protein